MYTYLILYMWICIFHWGEKIKSHNYVYILKLNTYIQACIIYVRACHSILTLFNHSTKYEDVNCGEVVLMLRLASKAEEILRRKLTLSKCH